VHSRTRAAGTTSAWPVAALIRKKALIELDHEDWARKMQILLRRACHAVNLARERGIPLLRLHQRRSDVLRFLHDPSVPFTNNQAKADARMMKLRQKISGGFRAQGSADDFVVIRSVLSTAKKQSWNILKTLMQEPEEFSRGISRYRRCYRVRSMSANPVLAPEVDAKVATLLKSGIPPELMCYGDLGAGPDSRSVAGHITTAVRPASRRRFSQRRWRR
jgi:hypothetical protein